MDLSLYSHAHYNHSAILSKPLIQPPTVHLRVITLQHSNYTIHVLKDVSVLYIT